MVKTVSNLCLATKLLGQCNDFQNARFCAAKEAFLPVVELILAHSLHTKQYFEAVVTISRVEH